MVKILMIRAIPAMMENEPNTKNSEVNMATLRLAISDGLGPVVGDLQVQVLEPGHGGVDRGAAGIDVLPALGRPGRRTGN